MSCRRQFGHCRSIALNSISAMLNYQLASIALMALVLGLWP